MNATKMCKVLLAMGLAGGLMAQPRISGGQTGASSIGTDDATKGTERDDNENAGACEWQSVDQPDGARNGAGRKCAKARPLFEQGKAIFRFDTFGDEDYWGGKLQLHKAIEGTALGGVDFQPEDGPYRRRPESRRRCAPEGPPDGTQARQG